MQSGRLELFSLDGLAAQAADADAETCRSLGTLEVPDDQVRDTVHKLSVVLQSRCQVDHCCMLTLCFINASTCAASAARCVNASSQQHSGPGRTYKGS